MDLIALVAVQWLHILAGIAWFGGYIFLDFVLLPALLRQPAAPAQATFTTVGKYAGIEMQIAGMLVVLLGIVRGTLLGPIKSFGFLFTSAYGITWLVALVITLALAVWGATWHTHLLGPIWEGDRVRPGAVARLRMGTVFEMTCFAAVLGCMVLMSVGR